MRDQMIKLMGTLKEANNAYYNSGQPIMADSAYDYMKKQFRQMVLSHPQIAVEVGADKFLSTVGTAPDLNTYDPVHHNPPMLSLDNAFGDADYEAWTHRHKIVDVPKTISLKLDGSAVELAYTFGQLICASTRGDGKTGEDITASLLQVPNVPKLIDSKESVVFVRGEVVLSFVNFEKAKEIDNYSYANPRNAANGIVRRKKPTKSTQLLQFIAYSVVGMDFESHEESLKWLATQRFTIAPYRKVNSDAEALEVITRTFNRRKQGELPWPIDGMVAMVDSVVMFNQLGLASEYPHGAIAYKFETDKAETKLLAVEWTKGLKGRLSPNARLETIFLAGTNVSNALLHTADHIQELGLMIGDTVIVEKSGEIIPQVIGVRTDLRTGSEKPIPKLTKCPLCGDPVTIEGDYVACYSNDCGDVKVNKLLTFINAINFKGIGDVTAQNLCELDKFESIPDFYRLTAEDLVEAGVQPKTAQKVAAAIQESIGKSKPKQILAGFGIRMCGEGTAEDLVEDFGLTIKDLLRYRYDDFLALEGLGPEKSERLAKWFGQPQNQEMVEELYKMGVIVDGQKTVASSNKLAGKTILFTGTLSQPREYFEQLVNANGGKFTNTYKKTIDVLVVGEKAGSKLGKAKNDGVTIWTEQDFMDAIK